MHPDRVLGPTHLCDSYDDAAIQCVKLAGAAGQTITEMVKKKIILNGMYRFESGHTVHVGLLEKED
jgi:hypothetical protein